MPPVTLRYAQTLRCGVVKLFVPMLLKWRSVMVQPVHEGRSMLAEARNTLSDIYNWFTEGFDTKDLQEAKTLLEEFS